MHFIPISKTIQASFGPIPPNHAGSHDVVREPRELSVETGEGVIMRVPTLSRRQLVCGPDPTVRVPFVGTGFAVPSSPVFTFVCAPAFGTYPAAPVGFPGVAGRQGVRVGRERRAEVKAQFVGGVSTDPAWSA